MRFVLLLTLVPIIWAKQCSRTQYWSSTLSACVSCTKCDKNQIVVHQCGTHRDTECKTISEAGLDLSWLDTDADNDIFELADEQDELVDKRKNSKSKKKTNKKHHLLKLSDVQNGDNDDDIYQDFLHSKHDFGKKKNKKHHKSHHNQRINDKFLKWDDNEELSTKKPRQNRLVFDPYLNFPTEKTGHHFTFPAEDEDLSTGKHKMMNVPTKKGKVLHAKHDPKGKSKASYNEEDEEKLEEWLIISAKEFAQRSQDLLKNIKKSGKTETTSDDSEGKLKLNYPLYKMDLMGPAAENSLRDSTKDKHKSIINDDIFRDRITANLESEADIGNLLSNKESPIRDDAGAQRLFKDEPSTISEIMDQAQMSEERSDNGINYQKSQLTVASANEDSTVVDAVPFTAVERFVWDWQAVALISAVTACLLFFVVVMVYSLFTGSRYKQTKSSSYTADMEEMSTRIALMQQTFEPSLPIANSPGKLPTTISTSNEK